MLKPSPYTPLTTLKLGEILNEVFPAGVVNVLAGGDELGAAMTAHPNIDKISFTGSVATGKKVLASAAATMKRVTLELGGNDPAIVLDDVDAKAVAKKIFFASFVNSGQVCMAIKRIYAHERIYDDLCAALAEEAKKAKVGNGLDPATELGPVQNKMQYDKVVGLIEDTKKAGAKFLAGGEIPIPIVQSAGTGNTSINVEFKEFGVKLDFEPTVIDSGIINLRVVPEVSQPDFANDGRRSVYSHTPKPAQSPASAPLCVAPFQ